MAPSDVKTPDEVQEERQAEATAEDAPAKASSERSAKRAPVDDVVEDARDDLPPVESETEAKAVLEALLYATNTPLSARKLAALVPGHTPGKVTELLLALRDEFEESARGVTLQEVAGGWTVATRPRYADYVYALHPSKRRNPLTAQALETLAIVAYRQPIARADIEVIRGVDSGGMLRNLLDLGLITIVGHRETLGRPPLYGTTDQFLKIFGLKSLAEMPSIEELEALLPAPAPEPLPDEAEAEAETGEESNAEVVESAEGDVEESASADQAEADAAEVTGESDGEDTADDGEEFVEDDEEEFVDDDDEDDDDED